VVGHPHRTCSLACGLFDCNEYNGGTIHLHPVLEQEAIRKKGTYMSSRAHVEMLIKDLGQLIGLDTLALNASGACCLVFDSKIYVEIEHDVETDWVVFTSNLGQPKTGEKEPLYRRLLQNNYFWKELEGVTMALHGVNGDVFQICVRAASAIDFPEFQNVLEKFVDLAEKWMEIIGREHLDLDAELKTKADEGHTDDRTISGGGSEEESGAHLKV